MGYNLLLNGAHWGYNPLTNLLLTSWDIQELGLGRELLQSKIPPHIPHGRYQKDPHNQQFLFGNFFLCGGFGDIFPGYVGKLIATRFWGSLQRAPILNMCKPRIRNQKLSHDAPNLRVYWVRWFKQKNSDFWVVVSNIFYVHPYLGKIPILTNIFQRGWNHQLDFVEKTQLYEFMEKFTVVKVDG